MWKWIVGTFKVKHALDAEIGTPRALRRFVAQLPHDSPEQALQAIAAVFDAAPELGISPAARLHALCVLDELAHRFRRALSARLLDHSPRQVLCEPAWNALARSYSATERGYAHLVETLAGAASDDRSHAHIALAACRAMHAMAKANMLQRMRYREAPSALWPRIERLFAGAQARSQADAALVLYPDEPGETTLRREYLAALLFEVAPSSNLLPAQIHGVDLLLRAYAADPRMGDTFDRAMSPFVLDPVRDPRPKRWPNGVPPRPGLRFFGLGEAYPRILAEREHVSRARGTPEWLASSQLTAERYREMLDALCIHWALTPPRRRQQRRPAQGEILVAHDFTLVRRLVGFCELARSGRSLDYERFSDYQVNTLVRGPNEARLEAPGAPRAVSAEEALRNLETFERALAPGALEPWRLADTSADGIGADARGTGAWAKVGMLLAYRHPESAQWAMAVVRRLSRGPDGRLRVGLRKLHGRAEGARVTINDPRQNVRETAPGPALNYEAILLRADEPFLLLRPGVFDPAWRYTLSVGHHWDFIRMQRCVECGLDFEQIAYTVTKARQVA